MSAFFLAISPWHLQFSRAAFEGNIGLFFFITGFLFLLKSLRHGNFFYFSSISFLLSLYSYHSFRLFVPLFLLAFLVVFWKGILNFKKQAVISLAILLLLSFPIWNSFLRTGTGTGARLSMVTIFSDVKVINPSIKRIDYYRNNNDYIGTLFHNRRVAYTLAAAKGYLDHFNPDFLFIHGDGWVQHHAVNVGMLYLWDLPFIVAGIYYLLKKHNRFILILFASFLLFPIPASLTTGTPHPVRAIGMILGFHIFAAVGIVFFWEKIMLLKKIFMRTAIILIILICFMINVAYYFHDQPYIYYLFYNKIDPLWYQRNWDYNKNGETDRFKRVIGKYTFKNIEYSKDINLGKTLLIGTPDEIPDSAHIIKIIEFPDGKTAFKIVET